MMRNVDQLLTWIWTLSNRQDVLSHSSSSLRPNIILTDCTALYLFLGISQFQSHLVKYYHFCLGSWLSSNFFDLNRCFILCSCDKPVSWTVFVFVIQKARQISHLSAVLELQLIFLISKLFGALKEERNFVYYHSNETLISDKSDVVFGL